MFQPLRTPTILLLTLTLTLTLLPFLAQGETCRTLLSIDTSSVRRGVHSSLPLCWDHGGDSCCDAGAAHAIRSRVLAMVPETEEECAKALLGLYCMPCSGRLGSGEVAGVCSTTCRDATRVCRDSWFAAPSSVAPIGVCTLASPVCSRLDDILKARGEDCLCAAMGLPVADHDDGCEDGVGVKVPAKKRREGGSRRGSGRSPSAWWWSWWNKAVEAPGMAGGLVVAVVGLVAPLVWIWSNRRGHGKGIDLAELRSKRQARFGGSSKKRR